jgi:chemotaxis protein CheX
MEAEYLEPFVIETIRTFEVMFSVKPEVTERTAKNTPDSSHDVSATIGVSGTATGAVVLGFSEQVACRIAAEMLQEEQSSVGQDVSDAVGELINIVVGNAKRDLVKYGFRDLSVSLPSVVVGKHRTVWRTKDLPCHVARFTTPKFGAFSIEVNIHQNP